MFMEGGTYVKDNLSSISGISTALLQVNPVVHSFIRITLGVHFDNKRSLKK